MQSRHVSWKPQKSNGRGTNHKQKALAIMGILHYSTFYCSVLIYLNMKTYWLIGNHEIILSVVGKVQNILVQLFL